MIKKSSLILGMAMTMIACNKTPDSQTNDFNYIVDRFADIEVLRYPVDDFENLTLDQKKYIYYLTEAALWGRDIYWDQNCAVNLPLRDVLENIYINYDGDKSTADYQAFETYMKQVWFGNGIHHHYSMDKFTPTFSKEFFADQLAKTGVTGEDADKYTDIVFNPQTLAKRSNQADGVDLIQTSACNFYGDGVTQAEVEAFYGAMKDPNNHTPVMYGLNSRVVKGEDGKLKEEQYKIGGVYSATISKIVENLAEARKYAENDQQRKTIDLLIDYYKTGDLKTFDEYSIVWAQDTISKVDFINGFIESYGDPLGMKGSWESIVNFKNEEASHRTEILSENAQWFEDNSPVDPSFRKDEVKGVSAKVITAAILAGDSYPSTPIGINLPNSNWIRAQHGSKSVTIENITHAYSEAAQGSGSNEEFVIDEPTLQLLDKHLYLADNLHTDLHECLGHGSGKLLPGVDPDALKAHGSTLEETRADLFALYYLGDPKLVELGLIEDPDTYKAEYYKYLLNGLMTQLYRIEPGKDIEEAHMRNRKLISEWVYQHGKDDNVVEYVTKDGKTYIQINDYKKLRELFGQLLGEVQRIKSTGDYEAGRQLVETYAVKFDPKLHAEVIERFNTLNIAPYKGFVNPIYTPVMENGEIVDIKVSYDEDYPTQMLRYSRDYSLKQN